MILLPRENAGDHHFKERYVVPVQNVIDTYSEEVVRECLATLEAEAEEHGGLDAVQTFVDEEGRPPIIFESDFTSVGVSLG